MVGSPSFTPRSLLALSRALVHEQPGQLIGLCGSPRRPVTEPSGFTAEVDELLGFCAPTHWRGLAIVVCGSSDPVAAATSISQAGHLHVAYLLDRQGHQAITVADDDGAVLASSHTVAGGYVTDVCHRILGIACDPERRPVGAWVVAQWLTLVLDVAADPATSSRAANWSQVAQLHPAFDPTLSCAPDELAEATIETVLGLPWPVLREQVADGLLHVETITPPLARWMDDAFFARFLLEGCREVDDLLDDLRLFLDDETLDMVRLTVEITLEPWRPAAPWP